MEEGIGDGLSVPRTRPGSPSCPVVRDVRRRCHDRSARTGSPVRRARARRRRPSRHVPGPGAGIRVDDVSLTFRGARTTTALEHLSLEVAPREVVALIGPNGCGKSTLLRILAGLIAPDAGSVTIDGRPVTGPDPSIGLVFQEPRLLAWRSVDDNVRFPMELAGWPRDRQAARSAELLGPRRAAARSPVPGRRRSAAAPASASRSPGRSRSSPPRSCSTSRSAPSTRSPASGSTPSCSRCGSAPARRSSSSRTRSPRPCSSPIGSIVLSPRPGRVVADVRVDLPRPRRLADLDTASAGRIAAEIRSHLVDTTDDER